MSWEEMGRRMYKCPCGSGTYTIISLMDDWNRSTENWEMDCPTCKHSHRLYSYSNQDSGKLWNEFVWVKEIQYDKLKSIEIQLENIKEDIVNTVELKYMNRWLSYFHNAKTKLEIWRRLTDNGKRYPSLSTFYNHIRNKDTATYIRGEFHYNNIQLILRKININDKEIQAKIKTANDLENKLCRARNQLIRDGYT